MKLEVRVPDVGELDKVEVVEVLVASGDRVAAEDSLITLESDKASMDIPAPQAGTIAGLAVAVGDQVGEGDLIVTMEVEEEASQSPPEPADKPPTPEPEDKRPTSVSAESEATPDETFDTELLVLGSGPGGYAAAFRAADLGLKVTLVERYETIGGVCLNVGCIPSKALLHLAQVIDEAGELDGRGVRFGAPEIDLDKVRFWKDGVVSRLTRGLAGMAEKRGVDVVHGTGRFSKPHSLLVEGGEAGSHEISFDRAIIAVGSRPTSIPGLPQNDPRVMDSTGALALEEIPGRLLVVGGGIIGLEMASVYAALGSAVTVVEMLPRLMLGCDEDLLKPLVRRVRKRYEKIWLETRVAGVQAVDEGLQATFDGPKAPETALFDRILVAVGRRSNGADIDAAAAGVVVDERGFVQVDEQQRTNAPHIFAIGDVTGDPMLAHRATHQGKVAAEAAAGLWSAFEAQVIPSVAYTDPEIAWVGLGEEDAARDGIEVGVGRFPWSASGRSLALGRSEGFTKLIFDPVTKRLLGAGIVGPGAGDLISEVALAIEMGADAEDLSLTVHPHPTLSETVAGAAEVFLGTVTDLYIGK